MTSFLSWGRGEFSSSLFLVWTNIPPLNKYEGIFPGHTTLGRRVSQPLPDSQDPMAKGEKEAVGLAAHRRGPERAFLSRCWVRPLPGKALGRRLALSAPVLQPAAGTQNRCGKAGPDAWSGLSGCPKVHAPLERFDSSQCTKSWLKNDQICRLRKKANCGTIILSKGSSSKPEMGRHAPSARFRLSAGARERGNPPIRGFNKTFTKQR